MTALAGLWGLDGRDAKALCSTMLVAQAAYGTSAPVLAAIGTVAAGRRLTPLLPEDRFDRGPLSGSDGRLLLVGDVRLDNRVELGAALGLGAEAAGLSDSALLLGAWERWEDGALARLTGAFAFALWDDRTGRLALGRDPHGQKPLFYHRGRDFVAFASMPCGLHALQDVPYELDRLTLARFIDLLPLGPERTFFEGIEQVPPGHVVSISRDRVDTVRFWNPPLEPIRLRHSSDYVEAVRELLDQAVDACLRGGGGCIGAHLSAGLDSAGVAATAARLSGKGKVIGFTAVPRAGFVADSGVGLIDEGPLAAATAACHPNIEHVLVRATGISPLAGFDRGFELFQRPLPNPCNYVWGSAIQDEAKARGLKVLLTGQMGNLTFSHDGLDLFPDLLRSGRLVRLVREISGLRDRGDSPRTIAGLTIGPLIRGCWPHAINVVRRESRRRRGNLSLGRSHQYDWQRALVIQRPLFSGAEARLRAFEQFDFGAFHKGMLAGWGIDLRDPTADRRLVEYCLRIPPDQFLSGGIRRALARRVLADRLPPVVLEETRRGRQAADWYEGLDANHAAVREESRSIRESVQCRRTLDVERMARLVENWPDDWKGEQPSRLYRRSLLRALSAGHFARKVEACANKVRVDSPDELSHES
jgi:asparagine synthase (glutamine-hydrolysing)